MRRKYEVEYYTYCRYGVYMNCAKVISPNGKMIADCNSHRSAEKIARLLNNQTRAQEK